MCLFFGIMIVGCNMLWSWKGCLFLLLKVKCKRFLVSRMFLIWFLFLLIIGKWECVLFNIIGKNFFMGWLMLMVIICVLGIMMFCICILFMLMMFLIIFLVCGLISLCCLVFVIILIRFCLFCGFLEKDSLSFLN